MALIGKKKDVPKSDESLVDVELVMEGKTMLVADEQSEFCHAVFQTAKPLSPEEWRSLAQAARADFVFKLVVTKK